MTLEKTICDLMAAVTGVDTWFGAQPQGSDDEPAKLPVVIVNRPDSTWLSTFCGTDVELAITVMRIDFWHATAEGSRRMSDKGRAAMTTLTDDKGPLAPILSSEVTYYEPMARAWRTMQQWRVPDYQPSLPALP